MTINIRSKPREERKRRARKSKQYEREKLKQNWKVKQEIEELVSYLQNKEQDVYLISP